MVKEKISVKYLIHLVSERPALWDRTSEAYKDRKLKEVSWQEVCAYINEDYDRMPIQLQQQFCKMVSKKWIHVRDCWVKSMRNGYDVKTMRPMKPYIYHNELHFLQKMLKCQRRLDILAKMDDSEIDCYLFEDNNTTKYQYQRQIDEGLNGNGYGNDHDVDNNHHNSSAIQDNGLINVINKFLKTTSEATGPSDQAKLNMERNLNLNSNYRCNNGNNNNDNNDDDDDANNWPLNINNKNHVIDIKEESIPEQLPENMFKARDYFKHGTKIRESYSSTISSSTSSTSVVPNANSNIVSTTATSTTSTTIGLNGGKRNLTENEDENRHWNFFRGILPSVNRLNDMETLEFQAGVISLLQKLRAKPDRSLASNSNSDKKLTQADPCSDSCSMYEWNGCSAQFGADDGQQNPQQPQNHYQTRSRKRNFETVDPLKSSAQRLDGTDLNGETVLPGSDILIS